MGNSSPISSGDLAFFFKKTPVFNLEHRLLYVQLFIYFFCCLFCPPFFGGTPFLFRSGGAQIPLITFSPLFPPELAGRGNYPGFGFLRLLVLGAWGCLFFMENHHLLFSYAGRRSFVLPAFREGNNNQNVPVVENGSSRLEKVLIYETVGSTNDEAKLLARRGYPEGRSL